MGSYIYGKSSKANLDTCTINLQLVMIRALDLGLIDISITEGARDKGRQNRLFELKKSKVKWPHSKHNIINSWDRAKAVDAVPFVNGKASYNYNHCCFMAGVILAVGASMGVELRWGGNWDMDGEPITDQDFQDLVHFEEVTS